MEAIQFKDVWETYRIKFIDGGKVSWEDFSALKGINFKVQKGEILGIIGENGAGKSTILKLIAGMLEPDKGEIEVEGRVSCLLELGAGFQPELTGRENIFLNAGLFGLTPAQIEEKYEEIVNFASLGKFINAPVKCYSQGMFVRLAFAIAIHVDPDILLIDDIFVVGDISAQRKCIKKIFELKEKGITIIIVLQDLEILKRICSRAIFLKDGVIIKDGAIDAVCSYYMETIGDKKGIAIMQEGPLGVIFNNGRLILRWQDRTITRDLPGNSRMTLSGRTYLSYAADWQIEKSKTGKEIVAIGKWPDINISQRWKISLINQNEFDWEIILDVPEENSVEGFQALLAFLDEYKSWFTLDAETNFLESFNHEKIWECVPVDSSMDKVIGLRGGNNSVALPVIVLEKPQDNMETICQVGNTDSEIKGRVIEYQAFPAKKNNDFVRESYRYFSGKIRVFEAQEKERLSLYLNHARQLLDESAIIRKGPLSIFCKNNSVAIYWRDKELTCGRGLNTIFKCQNINYNAQDGRWKIFKKNEEIIIVISWGEKLPFTQTWKLRLQAEDSVIWEIEMDIDEELKLRNKEVKLLLAEEYDKWLTPEEAGDFDRLEKRGGAILSKYINKYIGVEVISRNKDILLPTVMFKYEDECPQVSSIAKANGETKLGYRQVDSKENSFIAQGKYKYFKGMIKVFAGVLVDIPIKQPDDRLSIIGTPLNLSSNVESKELSFVFNHGQGRLFWKGLEFTKGLGMYSSVFFGGFWHDSSQAIWDVKRLDKERIVVVGSWPSISLIQTWDIAILDKATISWKINQEIWEDTSPDREQVNIMLSEKYQKWFLNKHVHGKFPQKFSEHNGVFWDRLWCGGANSPLGIKYCKAEKDIFNSQFLPSIIFSSSKDCRVRYSVIENTDNLFQARVLQYEIGAKQAFGSEGNKYFEGQVKVIP